MNTHNAAPLHGLHWLDGTGFGITGARGVKVFHSDQFVLPLPDGHRFPMNKYSMLRERVAAAGIWDPGEMRVPEPVTDAEVLTAHESGYLEKVVAGTLTAKEVCRIGFPWSRRMVERSHRASGGTLGTCRAALEEGVSANLAGGTHHGFAAAARACASSTTPSSPRASSSRRGSSGAWSLWIWTSTRATGRRRSWRTTSASSPSPSYNVLWIAIVVSFPLALFRSLGMETPNYPEIW
jgi:hypothetical protein